MSAAVDSTRAILYALGGNLAIAVAKLVAAVITGSGAMFAEAVHSGADCGNQLLLLMGMRRAKRAPTTEYPLGFGKEIYFWSFIVAIMLFSVGGLVSIYEGWHKLTATEDLNRPFIAIAVLVFSIAAESVSLRGALREAEKIRGGRNLWRWFRESRNAELVVIVGEDLAALLGLVIALVAVLATWVTGNPVYDALGSVAIGVLLVVVAALVGRETMAMLVGQGVEPQVRAEMLAFLTAEPQIERVIDMLTLHMGADVMVAVKAKMRPQGNLDALVDEINRIEAAFKQRFPQVQWTFFEPDVR
jgi:cation diffusion facilitator family transporter